MDQFICPTCMGGVVINRLCLFFSNNDNHEEEEAPPPAHPLPGAAGDPCPRQRRRRGSRGPDSVCPFLGCVGRTRKMRDHVTLVHLHPVFRGSVPPVAGAGLRYRVLLWLAHYLIGEGATLEDLASDVPTGEVFREPSVGVPPDITQAMNALCRFVGEEPLRRFSLFRRLHPALLIHWRVQAHLVSRLGPDMRRNYRELWAQEVLDGLPLSQYGMSQLLPPAAPAPCLEDWDAPDPPVLGSIAVEELKSQEDLEHYWL